jgi:hypothetical protein
MKRGTTEHPKFLDLMAQLSIPRYSAAGVLEMLWQFTSKFAPQGDVGRFSDSAIARALEWDNGADELMKALVDCRWVDKDPVHRLVVHDWYEHADDYVHARVARSKQFMVSGSAPKTHKLNSREREEANQFYKGGAATTDTTVPLPAQTADTTVPLPAQTADTTPTDPLPVPVPVPVPEPVPVPDKNLLSVDDDAGSVPKPAEPKSEFDSELDDVVRAMHDRHPAPRRCGPAIIRKSLLTIARESPTGERIAVINAIDKRHAAWCVSDAWTKDGGEYAKSLERWLAPTMMRYLDEPPAPKPQRASMEFGKGLFQ